MELTLQRSLEIALAKNLSLRIAQLNRDALQTEVARALAQFDPSVGFALTASGERPVSDVCDPPSHCAPHSEPEVLTQTGTPFIRTLLPTGASVLLSSDLSRQDTQGARPPVDYNSGLTLSIVQPLLRGGRVYVVTKPVKDAEFDARIEGARLNAEVLRVIAATKSAYYAVVLGERVIGVTEDALERDRALVDASQSLFRAGIVTRRDVLSAELQLAKDQARLVEAQADLASARIVLANVLGLPIGSEPVLVDRQLDPHLIEFDLERWIASAVKNRPEIMEAGERLNKSALNVRVAKNSLLPQLDAVASFGRSQSSASFGRSLGIGGHAWSVGLVFSVPLGNAAAKASAARAEIDHRRLEQELEQQKRLVELEVRQAVIKLRRSLDSIKAFTAVVEQAKGKIEVARARFALGLATNFDVTDAQADLLDAETDLLRAITDYNTGLAELEARVAGPV